MLSILKVIPIFLSIGVITLILVKIPFKTISNSLINLDYHLLPIFAFIAILGPLINSFKLFYLLKFFEIKFSFINCIKSVISVIPLNVIIPAKGGDFLKIFLFKSFSGIKIVDSTKVCIIERIIDFISLIFIGIIASIYLYSNIYLFLLFSFFILFLLCIFLFFNLRYIPLAFSIFLNFSRWLLNCLVYTLIIFHQSVPKYQSFVELFSISPISIFVGILPITFWGIGTRESILSYLVSHYYSIDLLIGAGFYYILVFYWIPSITFLPATLIILNKYYFKKNSAN